MSLRLEKAITNLKNNWYQDELNNYAESFGVDNPESIPLDDLQESNYKDLRTLISCQDEVNLILANENILLIMPRYYGNTYQITIYLR